MAGAGSNASTEGEIVDSSRASHEGELLAHNVVHSSYANVVQPYSTRSRDESRFGRRPAQRDYSNSYVPAGRRRHWVNDDIERGERYWDRDQEYDRDRESDRECEQHSTAHTPSDFEWRASSRRVSSSARNNDDDRRWRQRISSRSPSLGRAQNTGMPFDQRSYEHDWDAGGGFGERARDDYAQRHVDQESRSGQGRRESDEGTYHSTSARPSCSSYITQRRLSPSPSRSRERQYLRRTPYIRDNSRYAINDWSPRRSNSPSRSRSRPQLRSCSRSWSRSPGRFRRGRSRSRSPVRARDRSRERPRERSRDLPYVVNDWQQRRKMDRIAPERDRPQFERQATEVRQGNQFNDRPQHSAIVDRSVYDDGRRDGNKNSNGDTKPILFDNKNQTTGAPSRSLISSPHSLDSNRVWNTTNPTRWRNSHDERLPLSRKHSPSTIMTNSPPIYHTSTSASSSQAHAPLRGGYTPALVESSSPQIYKAMPTNHTPFRSHTRTQLHVSPKMIVPDLVALFGPKLGAVDIDWDKARIERKKTATLVLERTRDVLKSEFDVMMASFEVAKFEKVTDYYESVLRE